MPSLYALLVAIDRYPVPRHQLQGCVRDLQAFEKYLQQHCEGMRSDYYPLVLTDSASTREAIIRGFEHFDAAREGDQCLFYFAGHGSRQEADPAFWHIEPDRQNESLVCYDSRTEGGSDLLDKELSYLIWKATRDKNVRFTVILDCCHAGSGTRLTSQSIWPRIVEPATSRQPVDQLLGYPEFERGADGQLSPPTGPHLLLAAARDGQTAKETYIEGERRGVFTYSLIETLRQFGGQLSYPELASHLRIRTGQRVHDQSPQLEIVRADPNTLFLGNRSTAGLPFYLVSFDQLEGWIVNAGAIDGFSGGGGESRTELKLETDGQSIWVVTVKPAFSRVSGMDQHPKERVFRATIERWGATPLPVACAEDVPEGVRKELGRQFGHDQGPVELTEHIRQARYLIRCADESLALTLPESGRPLFRRIRGHSPEAVADLVPKLRTVARWVQLLELAKPSGAIQEGEFRIELFRMTDPVDRSDAASKEAVDWRLPVYLPYFFHRGKGQEPALQIRITNTSDRPLWFSALYLAGDFGIYNQLMPKLCLEPQQEGWLIDLAHGVAHRTILLQLEEAYHSWGLIEIAEFFKILVSTEEFDTDRYNQSGLPLDERPGGTRDIHQWETLPQPDWTTREIELRLLRPLEGVAVPAEGMGRLFGLELHTPAGLSLHFRLSHVEAATRAFPRPCSTCLETGEELRPYELMPGQGQVQGLSVLEFSDLPKGGTVDADRPLILSFDRESDGVLPCHCDPNSGLFRELKHAWENGKLCLLELPPATPSGVPGMGNTVKVFLQRRLGPEAWGAGREIAD